MTRRKETERVYHIKVGGNMPATAHGHYYRVAASPDKAKRKLAYYFREYGRCRFSVGYLIARMQIIY